MQIRAPEALCEAPGLRRPPRGSGAPNVGPRGWQPPGEGAQEAASSTLAALKALAARCKRLKWFYPLTFEPGTARAQKRPRHRSPKLSRGAFRTVFRADAESADERGRRARRRRLSGGVRGAVAPPERERKELQALDRFYPLVLALSA
eukprot:3551129-Alexandrium_andersonii.AAC.1